MDIQTAKLTTVYTLDNPEMKLSVFLPSAYDSKSKTFYLMYQIIDSVAIMGVNVVQGSITSNATLQNVGILFYFFSIDLSNFLKNLLCFI